MEDEMEKLRLLLTDGDSMCEQLCDILSDSASKTEIKYKVNVLETSYTTFRKKIGNNQFFFLHNFSLSFTKFCIL